MNRRHFFKLLAHWVRQKLIICQPPHSPGAVVVRTYRSGISSESSLDPDTWLSWPECGLRFCFIEGKHRVTYAVVSIEMAPACLSAEAALPTLVLMAMAWCKLGVSLSKACRIKARFVVPTNSSPNKPPAGGEVSGSIKLGLSGEPGCIS